MYNENTEEVAVSREAEKFSISPEDQQKFLRNRISIGKRCGIILLLCQSGNRMPLTMKKVNFLLCWFLGPDHVKADKKIAWLHMN